MGKESFLFHGKGVKMVMLYHLEFSLSRKRKYFCSSMKSCFFLYDVVMTKAGDEKKELHIGNPSTCRVNITKIL